MFTDIPQIKYYEANMITVYNSVELHIDTSL